MAVELAIELGIMILCLFATVFLSPVECEHQDLFEPSRLRQDDVCTCGLGGSPDATTLEAASWLVASHVGDDNLFRAGFEA